MVRKHDGPRGRVDVPWHDSACLRNNPWGDDSRREVAVYLPPGYETDTDARYPVLFDLAAYTSSGLAHVGWKGFQENLPERLDRLIGSGAMGEVIVVFPDGYTKLGGNQYVNSSAVGAYADYLVDELVPFVDERYRTLADRNHRGLFGRSSGGYGALMHALWYPETWGAAACHSGDLYFEHCFRRDLPVLADVLGRYDGSVESFMTSFAQRPKPRGEEIHALMLIGLAATFDPDPRAPLGFHLPIDPHTCEINPARWQQWLRFDPVELVANHVEALQGLRGLFVDCGTRDQYYLHYGARILHRRLERLGVEHRYEEFDDNHSSLDYRFDISLPFLWNALR